MEAHRLVQNLECTLIPGSYPSAERVPAFYNSVYAYWKKTWGEFFVKAGSGPVALNVENFLRSKYIIVLHQGSTIVGTLSSSIFNTQADPTYDHSSVKPFPEHVQEAMKSFSPGAYITGEYLSVHPAFRKDILDLSLADVLVGLLLKIMMEGRYSAMLATPVRKAKVADITMNYGAHEVGSYLKIGVDCQMIYVTRDMYREHADARVNEVVQRLWAQRRDLTNETNKTKTEIPLKRVS
ncbi:MAG: hypothetical protein V4760_17465 [Bdellovibrionota bacterium]